MCASFPHSPKSRSFSSLSPSFCSSSPTSESLEQANHSQTSKPQKLLIREKMGTLYYGAIFLIVNFKITITKDKRSSVFFFWERTSNNFIFLKTNLSVVYYMRYLGLFCFQWQWFHSYIPHLTRFRDCSLLDSRQESGEWNNLPGKLSRVNMISSHVKRTGFFWNSLELSGTLRNSVEAFFLALKLTNMVSTPLGNDWGINPLIITDL